MSNGTLFRTKDGDLDLLWVMLGAHLVLGWVLTLAGLRLGEKAFVVAVTNNVVSILILAIIKVPIDRARLLAPALKQATAALNRPPFPGMDMNEHD
jgi:hypothetical protein